MLVIDSTEVDRARVGAEGTLATQIVVVVDIADGKLADGAKDRCAEAESGEVGFGNAAPETVLAINGENMIVIPDSLEIDKKRRVSIDA